MQQFEIASKTLQEYQNEREPTIILKKAFDCSHTDFLTLEGLEKIKILIAGTIASHKYDYLVFCNNTYYGAKLETNEQFLKRTENDYNDWLKLANQDKIKFTIYKIKNKYVKKRH